MATTCSLSRRCSWEQGGAEGETVSAAPVNGWIPLKRTNRALLQEGVLHFFREAAFPPDKRPYQTIVLLSENGVEVEAKSVPAGGTARYSHSLTP